MYVSFLILSALKANLLAQRNNHLAALLRSLEGLGRNNIHDVHDWFTTQKRRFICGHQIYTLGKGRNVRPGIIGLLLSDMQSPHLQILPMMAPP